LVLFCPEAIKIDSENIIKNANLLIPNFLLNIN